MSVIVIEFITLDGIVSDPDGSGGTPAGGWVFRHGHEAVTGDPFRLGSVLDNGVLLLGRKTWELFSRIWPGRDDPFSARMNAVPKLVAAGTLHRRVGVGELASPRRRSCRRRQARAARCDRHGQPERRARPDGRGPHR